MAKLLRVGRKLVRCSGKLVRVTEGEPCLVCDGGQDCWYRCSPCPTGGGPCGSGAPDIFIPCALACPDGEIPGTRVIAFPDDSDLSGFCWRVRYDDCRYTTLDPPPPDWCPLPDGAVTKTEGMVCVGDCGDPICVGRGDYLIPVLCEGQCGTGVANILVCPEEGMDLSKCRWSRVIGGADFCGCVVIGPTSRHFTGDPTGYTIIPASDAWEYALDPQSACCECCSETAYPCNRCRHETIPPLGPTCIADGAGRDCCCGDVVRAVVVGYGTYRSEFQRDHGDMRRELNDRKSFFSSTTRFTRVGSDYTKECVGAYARETYLQEVYTNGNLIFQEFQEDTTDHCQEGRIYIRDFCMLEGKKVALTPFRVWSTHGSDSAPNNWSTILSEMGLLMDPNDFRCNGSAVWQCPPDWVCTGSWLTRGGCGHAAYAGEIRSAGEASEGESLTNSASLRVNIFTFVESHSPDCAGGCGGKQPREIGSGFGRLFGGRRTIAGGGTVGAGDFL